MLDQGNTKILIGRAIVTVPGGTNNGELPRRGKKIGKNDSTRSASRRSCTELATKPLAARFKAEPSLLCTLPTLYVLRSTLFSSSPKTKHLLLSPNLARSPSLSPSSSLWIYRYVRTSVRLARFVSSVPFVSPRSSSSTFVHVRPCSSVFVSRATTVLSYRMTLQRYATNRRLDRRREPRGLVAVELEERA